MSNANVMGRADIVVSVGSRGTGQNDLDSLIRHGAFKGDRLYLGSESEPSNSASDSPLSPTLDQESESEGSESNHQYFSRISNSNTFAVIYRLDEDWFSSADGDQIEEGLKSLSFNTIFIILTSIFRDEISPARIAGDYKKLYSF